MTVSGTFTLDGTATEGAKVTVIDAGSDPSTVVGTDITAADGTYSVDVGTTTTVHVLIEYEDPSTGEKYQDQSKPFVHHESASGLPQPAGTPLAWWPMDEGAGTTVADNIGSHDGTITGATWVDGVGTWMGDTALTYDGLDDYTSIPHDSVLNVANSDFSFALTLQPNVSTYSTSAGILNKYQVGGSTTPNYGFYRQQNNTWTAFRVRDTGGTQAYVQVDDAAITIVDGKIRFVCVRSGDTSEVYANDSLVGSDTQALGDTSNTDPLNIGRYWTSNSINALIDDIVLYDYALSPQEITDDYQRQPWSP